MSSASDLKRKFASPHVELTAIPKLGVQELDRSGCPMLALNGHADTIERCPLLGEQRKTSARGEHFAF